MKKVQCPVCLNYTLPEDFTFEICTVCFWQDEGLNRHTNPDQIAGGPNQELSLNQARENYKKYGAKRKELELKVRKPFDDELPENN